MNDEVEKMQEMGITENQAYALASTGIKASEIVWMVVLANATGQSVSLYADALLSVMPAVVRHDNLSLVAQKGKMTYNANQRVYRRARNKAQSKSAKKHRRGK